MGNGQLARIAGTAITVLAVALAVAGAAAGASEPSPDPGPPGGSLIAGGPLTGTADVDFLVNPSGVYTATIAVDGNVVVSETVDDGSAHLDLDTATLVDGSHSVIVAVGDGDTTDTVWSGAIETLNAPQGGVPTLSGTAQVGATLSASPGIWSPEPSTISFQWERCSAGGGSCAAIAGAVASSYELTSEESNAQVEVEVIAADASGSTSVTSAPSPLVLEPGASALASGAPNGTGACDGAALSARFAGGSSQTVALGHGATVRGRVECGGVPIAGATVDLELAPASGTVPPVYAQSVTDASGAFTYAVPAGPSRAITLSYTAYAGSGQPASVATLALRVTPRLTLRITPRSTTNGHSMTLTGRVLGGYIAPHGLPLEIEYRDGSRWMIYTEVLADADTGRFRWTYTFERTTESITYTFRVAIPATGVSDYPYEPVASPSRSVHVDP